jgi:hypothetical protein
LDRGFRFRIQETGGKNMNNLTYSEAKKKHFQTLKQYVPVVERVYGGRHPAERA